MEREQIIKALGYCKSPKLTKCDGCPREKEDGHCMYRLNEDALSLIKELSEENERLKAARYMLHSDGRLEMIPSVESSKVKLERITVIVREHLDEDPFEKAIAEANGAKPKGSTVGVKISVGGEQYGTYVCFKQSTLSASEVAECINGQFETLLKGLEKTE